MWDENKRDAKWTFPQSVASGDPSSTGVVLWTRIGPCAYEERTPLFLEEFPVHFGIVDGVWSADGLLGIKSDLKPEHTQTIIAGSNLVAVDIVGGRKMGLNPMKNLFVSRAVRRLGRPDIRAEGDESVYENWNNVPPGVEHVLNYGEEWYGFSNLLGFLSSEMDPVFPMKPRYRVVFGLRRATLSLLKFVSRFER
ncbi:hypothetical protein [Halalkalicoccus salilacus]